MTICFLLSGRKFLDAVADNELLFKLLLECELDDMLISV